MIELSSLGTPLVPVALLSTWLLLRNHGPYRIRSACMSYFKPPRRKLGVITLLTACVLTIGWIRSEYIKDLISFLFPGGVKDTVYSVSGKIYWLRYPEPSMGPVHGIVSYVMPAQGWEAEFHSPAIEWSWRWQEFGSGKHRRGWVRFWSAPYWSIVLPLTSLSAYLLLSKPRQKRARGAA